MFKCRYLVLVLHSSLSLKEKRESYYFEQDHKAQVSKKSRPFSKLDAVNFGGLLKVKQEEIKFLCHKITISARCTCLALMQVLDLQIKRI